MPLANERSTSSAADRRVTESELLAQFADPPASHRSMPLWVWNGQMSEARITEMLEQYAARGMGGAFVHPRPGLITEYLSERWFELWKFAAAECRRLGMQCNIYDENSYPAGFAGGHVPSNRPDTAAQYVEALVHHGPAARWSGQLLGAYRIDARGHATALESGRSVDEALADGPVLTLGLRVATGSPWTAWFPMTDITRPEAVREFISTTYEQYEKHLGDSFGKTITTAFCDEPLLSTAGAYSSTTQLPLSRLTLKAFSDDHGYDLGPKLADLFVDQPGCGGTRFDYYRTLQRLWSGGFLRTLSQWCAKKGLQFTGHFMEHEWPRPSYSPSAMEGYRWLHIPGVDLLWPQCDFADPVQFGLITMTFRELNSAANQLGQARRLCETHGVGGYEATLEQMKRASDWIMVHGVNFVNQHLSFATISGARKYDHPQTLSDHSAWWDDYRAHADHVARLSVALSQGRQENRVLVLHSTTTGWMHYSPARPLVCEAGGPTVDPIQQLRQSEALLVAHLVDRQVDFDLGDELLLADYARNQGTRLRVGEATYDVVVVPSGMENLCRGTLELLEAFLAGGGRVLALGAAPAYVDGRPDARPQEMAQRYPGQWEAVKTLEALQDRLDRLAPPSITTDSGEHLPALVGHQMRRLEDGQRLHFLANHNDRPVSVRARLRGGSIRALDTLSGEARTTACRTQGQYVSLALELPVAGHVLWLVSDAPAEVAEEVPAVPWRPVDVQAPITGERLAPNVLGLDFCDLTVDGTTHKGLYVTRANKLCWQAHGFDQDVWDRAVQFRRNFIDMTCAPSSGFQVEYHLEMAAEGLGAIELAIERPELYRVQVNGHEVSFAEGARWFDETIRKVRIDRHLRAGINAIGLSARPFHILCEIDRIYLLGDFAADPAATGFRIAPCRALMLGDWTKQGLAQYDQAVRYRATFALPTAGRRLFVAVPQWAGAALRVRLDDRPVGTIAWPPYELVVEQPLMAGKHTVALDVVATPRNLLGPHFFDRPKKGRWVGPNAWDQHPDQPAAGREYELEPYGLLAPPHIAFEASP